MRTLVYGALTVAVLQWLAAAAIVFALGKGILLMLGPTGVLLSVMVLFRRYRHGVEAKGD